MSQSPDMTAIEQLEPKPVWSFFAGMCKVPHESKKEEKIRAHVRKLAEETGFKVREDTVGNVLIQVPAKPGCKNAPVTVLQGHLDMVCEKNSDVPHDFDNDPIKAVIDKDDKGEQIVRADGTTLGADNGIGVALAMAAATQPDVKHGPLEILCTIDEEMGMTGAKALAPDFFTGKRMLNLDSEEDGAIYIGCAGGCDTNLTWRFETNAPPAGAEVCRVAVSGLKGGHSGGDIHLNRANAIKLLVQTLHGAADIRLAEISGGSKRNAIPREASAVVVGPAGTTATLSRASETVRAEAVTDAKEAGCKIAVERSEAATAISHHDTVQLLTTISALPHGVLAVVPEIPGLVQTSNGTSIIKCRPDDGALEVEIACLSRSSSDVQLNTVRRQLADTGCLGGAAVEQGNDYPGWAPNVDSPILSTCRRVYEEVFGEAPNVAAIHAGLECGIIGQRMGGMDMVSFGPRIEGAHSPDERVYVASVQKSWKYLKAVLAELAKG
ncbi:MAG: aminoacyl-histidine dipeptidase [Planctomycetota bacterium]